MADIRSTDVGNGQFDLDITCSHCGKPITHSNEYGMYCDDECGIEEDKKATVVLEKMRTVMDELMDKLKKEFGDLPVEKPPKRK